MAEFVYRLALNRATRWMFIEAYNSQSASNAKKFLSKLHKAIPIKITKILTDNGKEFTDRFDPTGERTPTGDHDFDQLCQELAIEHRLTKPYSPQINGMVERFNGRIADILRTPRFRDAENLENTIKRYVKLYNSQLPQKALGHISPVESMKQWQRKTPDLFTKNARNYQGHDKFQGHGGY